jgi:hypothetical protein
MDSKIQMDLRKSAFESASSACPLFFVFPKNTFSPFGEIFKNRSGHFPQPRKSSKIVRDIFRGRGNLQKSFGTFSAAAETFKNRSGRFPQPRILWHVNYQIFDSQDSFRNHINHSNHINCLSPSVK